MPITLTGKILEFDKLTPNGYCFSKKCGEKLVTDSEIQLALSQRTLIGELNPGPFSFEVNASNAAIVTTGLDLQSDGVVATIEVLDTPAGQKVLDILIQYKGPDQISFCVRGVADLDRREVDLVRLTAIDVIVERDKDSGT